MRDLFYDPLPSPSELIDDDLIDRVCAIPIVADHGAGFSVAWHTAEAHEPVDVLSAGLSLREALRIVFYYRDAAKRMKVGRLHGFTVTPEEPGVGGFSYEDVWEVPMFDALIEAFPEHERQPVRNLLYGPHTEFDEDLALSICSAS